MNPSAVEVIRDENGAVMALIVRRGFRDEGIIFFTPEDFSQQLGYMCRPEGHVIAPHVHREVKRDVRMTQEVLFVRRGRVRVDLFSEARRFLCSRILEEGDVILLAAGGHGFTMLEETEIIEVKQGPYCGDDDKERFAVVRRK